MWDNQAVTLLITAIPSLVLAYLAYRQAIKKDKVAEESGVAEGWNTFVATVQEDNKTLRQVFSDLQQKYRELDERYRVLDERYRTLDERCEGLEREIRRLKDTNGKGPTGSSAAVS